MHTVLIIDSNFKKHRKLKSTKFKFARHTYMFPQLPLPENLEILQLSILGLEKNNTDNNPLIILSCTISITGLPHGSVP